MKIFGHGQSVKVFKQNLRQYLSLSLFSCIYSIVWKRYWKKPFALSQNSSWPISVTYTANSLLFWSNRHKIPITQNLNQINNNGFNSFFVVDNEILYLNITNSIPRLWLSKTICQNDTFYQIQYHLWSHPCCPRYDRPSSL